MMQPPPDKKRRTGSPSVATDHCSWDGDDDIDYNEVYETFEASQVPREQEEAPSLIKAHGKKPSSAPQFLTDFGVGPSSSSKIIGKGTTKSRSASDVSASTYGSSRSNYKSSFSATVVPHKPGVPMRTDLCGDGHHNQTNTRPRNSNTPSTSSSVLPKKQANSSKMEENMQKVINNLQSKCEALKKQIEEHRNSSYAKEGKISILQKKLEQSETELYKTKQEKQSLVNQQNREKSEHEKLLEGKVQKLETQLSYQSNELMQMQAQQTYNKNKENKVSSRTDSVLGNTQSRVDSLTPTSSPARARRRVEATSPRPVPGGFPSTQSFLAEEVSPLAKRNLASKLCKEKGTQVAVDAASSVQRPMMQLSLSNSRGSISGAQLVTKLLQAQTDTDGALKGRELSRRPVIVVVPDDQGGNTSGSSESSPTPTIKSTCSDDDPQNSFSAFQQNTTVLLRSINSLIPVADDQSSGQQIKTILDTQGKAAILLLPVIEECLSNYLSFIEQVYEPCFSSPSTASDRGETPSTNSPTDTVSSMQSLIFNAKLVNNTEELVVNRLHVLKCLTKNSHYVRGALLDELKPPEDIAVRMEIDGSSAETISSVGTSISSNESESQKQTQLLAKLCSMANPVSSQYKTSNLYISQLSLEVLASVLEGATQEDIDRFGTLPIEDFVIGCMGDKLEPSTKFQFCHCLMDLLKVLARSEKTMTALCAHSEECILDSMVQLCVQSNDSLISDRLILQTQLISILSTVSSREKMRDGLFLSTNHDCSCAEILKNIVLILHDQYKDYQKNQNEQALSTLRQGASLLQITSLTDSDYTERHQEVEPHYVELVCGLDDLFKTKVDDFHQLEKVVCHDLWDFKQDPLDDEDQDDTQGQEASPEPVQSQTGSQRTKEESSSRTTEGSATVKSSRKMGRHEEPMDVINID